MQYHCCYYAVPVFILCSITRLLALNILTLSSESCLHSHRCVSCFRALSVLGVNVQSWFEELPKVYKIDGDDPSKSTKVLDI